MDGIALHEEGAMTGDPDERQLAAITDAVDTMRRFGTYDVERNEELHISIPLPIFQVEVRQLEGENPLADAMFSGFRFLVDGTSGVMSVDLTPDEVPTLVAAVRGEAPERLARHLTQQEVTPAAAPRIIQVRGTGAEALWLPETNRLTAIIGPMEDDFIGGLRRNLRSEHEIPTVRGEE